MKHLRSAGADMFNAIVTMRPSKERGNLAVSLLGYVIELERFAHEANPRGFRALRRKALAYLRASQTTKRLGVREP